MTFRQLSAEESLDLTRQEKDLVVVDVRTPEEYASATGHLPKAILLPIQEFPVRWTELEPYRERPILVVCRSGNRSGMACRFLAQQGFPRLYNAPGMIDWNARNYEVERGAAPAGEPL